MVTRKDVSKAKTECRPVRVEAKSAVKTVHVAAHNRSTPKPLKPGCK